jgi:hypothetical protein
MEIKPFAETLKAAGLEAPAFDALVPNDRNYTALLFQPQSEIEGDKSGVRNRDRDRATAQFSAFLSEAVIGVVSPSASSPPRRHSPKPVRSPSGS